MPAVARAPPDPARPPRHGSSGTSSLLSGVTVAGRQRRRLRAGDRRPDERVYERLDAVAENKADVARAAGSTSRRGTWSSSARCPGSATTPGHSSTRPPSAADRSAAEARLREVLATVVSQTADARGDLHPRPRRDDPAVDVPAHEGIVQSEAPYFARGTSHTTVQNVYASDLTGSPDDHRGHAAVRPERRRPAGGRPRREPQPRSGSTGSSSSGPASARRAGPISSARDGRLRSTGAIERPAPTPTACTRPAIDDAVAGHSGQGLYADDRGVPVIGVYRWLADRGAGARRRDPPGRGVRRRPASWRCRSALVGLVSALLLADRDLARSPGASPGRSSTWRPTRRRVRGRRPRGAVRGSTRRTRSGTLDVAFDEMTAAAPRERRDARAARRRAHRRAGSARSRTSSPWSRSARSRS